MAHAQHIAGTRKPVGPGTTRDIDTGLIAILDSEYYMCEYTPTNGLAKTIKPPRLSFLWHYVWVT